MADVTADGPDPARRALDLLLDALVADDLLQGELADKLSALLGRDGEVRDVDLLDILEAP
ncbi:MAG: hypothetical protein R3F59_31225 [Myxococcota bacterium]